MTADAIAEIKDEASALFKAELYTAALDKYATALSLCTSADNVTKSLLHSNISACWIKLKNFNEAVSSAKLAHEEYPGNIKAKYRLSLAHEGLGNHSSALNTATEALKLDCENQELVSLVQRLQKNFLKEKSLINSSHSNALTLLSEAARAGISDSEKLEKALTSLRSFAVQGGRKQILRGDVIRLSVEVLQFSVESLSCLRVHEAILSLFLCLVREPIDKENANFNLKLQGNRKVDVDIQSARDSIKEQFDAIFASKLLDKYIKAGVCNLRATARTTIDTCQEIQIRRTNCSTLILEILESLYILDELTCVTELIYLAASNSTSEDIVQAGLQALGVQADNRRRKGNRIKALRASHTLLKLLEVTLQHLEEENSCRIKAEYALTACFILLADKDRAPEDQISLEDLTKNLLDPYLVQECDLQDFLAGLRCLTLLWLADRSAFKTCVISHNVLDRIIQFSSKKTREYPELQTVAATVLMHCMELPELRISVLTSDQNLSNLFRSSQSGGKTGIIAAVAIARLCVHGEETRLMIFEKFDFCSVAKSCLSQCETLVNDDRCDTMQNCQSTTPLLQSSLELILFLTLHGTFKEMLLNNDGGELLKSIEVVGNKIATNTLSAYYFCAIVCNLIRSRKDKENIRKQANNQNDAPQLSDEELEALREFMEKLPEHSRPEKFATFDRGDEETTNKLSSLLIHMGIPNCLVHICKAKTTSLAVMALATEALGLMGREQSVRGILVGAGSISALLRALKLLEKESVTYENDIVRIRQSLAHLCISINPQLLSYQEQLDILTNLINLLGHSYELYQYEAALAITNLTAVSENVRQRMLPEGLANLQDLAMSDNSLCRAAGIEGICNMAMCESFHEQIISGKHKILLQLLFAFLREEENERAQNAAAGSLAMLSINPSISKIFLEISNVNNLFKVLESDDIINKEDFQLRIFTLSANICATLDIEKDQKIREFKDKIINTIKLLNKNNFKNSEVLNLLESITSTH